jgi:hypothetical protein
MKPSIGRIVLVPMDPAKNNGADVAPAVITRVWSDTTVNVHVLPDGNVTEWRTSVVFRKSFEDREPGYVHCWTWPPRV